MADFDGGPGDDVYEGTADADVINGNGGNDTLSGGGGDDVIDGGEGNDLLKGGAGIDLLDGGAGDDQIFSGEDGESLYGGIGNDIIYGAGSLGPSSTYLYGGEGDDVYRNMDGSSEFGHPQNIVEFEGEGIDTIYSSGTWTGLYDNVENLITFAAYAYGNDLNNFISIENDFKVALMDTVVMTYFHLTTPTTICICTAVSETTFITSIVASTTR